MQIYLVVSNIIAAFNIEKILRDGQPVTPPESYMSGLVS